MQSYIFGKSVRFMNHFGKTISKVYNKRALIWDYFAGFWTSTVALADNIVAVSDTYNDAIDMVEIYGACEQDGTPTPDAPVEIRAVSGSLVVGGKNLVEDTSSDWNSINVSAYQGVIKRYLPCMLNQSYTYSLYGDNQTSKNIKLYSFGSNSSGATTENCYSNESLEPSQQGTLTAQVVLTNENTVSMSIGFYNPDHTNTEAEPMFYKNIMIELGDTATTYQPYYAPTSYPVPTLYGVGDYRDKLVVNRVSGTVEVERNTQYTALTGLETTYTTAYNPAAEQDDTMLTYYLFPNRQGCQSAVCSHLPVVIGGYVTSYQYSLLSPPPLFGADSNFLNVGVKIEKNKLSIADDDTRTPMEIIKAWLNEQYINDYPVEIVVTQEMPTTETLDYIKLPTYDDGTTIQFVPDDGAVSPFVEITLKTKSENTTQTATANALIALGVEPAETTAEQEQQLEELGVDAYA